MATNTVNIDCISALQCPVDVTRAFEPSLYSATPMIDQWPPVNEKRKRGQLATWVEVREFIFAGNAVFTLRSCKTGMRYTYKVRVKKGDLEEVTRRAAANQIIEDGLVCYFVNLLRGPDNTSNYSYLGVLRRPGRFFTTAKSQVGRHAAAHKALVWFLDEMKGERAVLGGHPLEFWHSGRCGRCGRLLTVPESVARGIGPECDKRRLV